MLPCSEHLQLHYSVSNDCSRPCSLSTIASQHETLQKFSTLVEFIYTHQLLKKIRHMSKLMKTQPIKKTLLFLCSGYKCHIGALHPLYCDRKRVLYLLIVFVAVLKNRKLMNTCFNFEEYILIHINLNNVSYQQTSRIKSCFQYRLVLLEYSHASMKTYEFECFFFPGNTAQYLNLSYFFGAQLI